MSLRYVLLISVSVIDMGRARVIATSSYHLIRFSVRLAFIFQMSTSAIHFLSVDFTLVYFPLKCISCNREAKAREGEKVNKEKCHRANSIQHFKQLATFDFRSHFIQKSTSFDVGVEHKEFFTILLSFYHYFLCRFEVRPLIRMYFEETNGKIVQERKGCDMMQGKTNRFFV